MRTKVKRDSLWQGILSPLMSDHRDWNARGRTGEGRLVLSDEDLQGADLRGLQGAKLERVDLSGSGVSLMEDVELRECRFEEAMLQLSSWDGAMIADCDFRNATLVLSRFQDARIEGGNWLGAWCENSSWTRSAVSNVCFVAACFTDSRFDGASFVDCDFSRADFSRVTLAQDSARCPGTRFVGCDFRGANIDGLRLNNTTFDHCMFAGLRGKPDLEGPCTLIAPDFSRGVPGGESVNGVPGVRDPEAVLRVWRERDADYLRHWYLFNGDAGYDPGQNYPERKK